MKQNVKWHFIIVALTKQSIASITKASFLTSSKYKDNSVQAKTNKQFASFCFII